MASSRPYKVTTKPPVDDVAVAEDHVEVKLDIPPIMPREAMNKILKRQLEDRRFGHDERGNLTREQGGVEVEIDLEKGTVTVSAEGEVKLPPSNPSPCSCRIQEAAQKRASAHNSLQQEVTQRLERALGKLGCELEGVVERATKEALKEKASSLGEIKHITEDPEGGSMTIVVEV